MHIALGGTFDLVHDGCLAPFEQAFKLGAATVGLTSDELASRTRHVSRYIRPSNNREIDLGAGLRPLAEGYDHESEVCELDKPTGITTEEGFGMPIIPSEIRGGGECVNGVHGEKGLKPPRAEVVEHAPAENGERISSTRIVSGEIDRHGNLTPNRKGRGRTPPNDE